MGAVIQPASPSGAAELLAIYAPYVEHTAVTFEYEVPTLAEFTGRMERVLEMFPYLKAVENGRILGYAYAGPFHPRAAYAWAVETTVYLDPAARRQGVGRQLYTVLERALAAQNVLNLNACIAVAPKDDEYLTSASVDFHKHFGYKRVGEFHRCGYKFNRWYNMVWMEKMIGEHKSLQPEVKLFPEIQDKIGFERFSW